MGLYANPPKSGDESFPQWEQEKNQILKSLKVRAQKLVASLNKLEGVSCQPANGSYILSFSIVDFNQLTIPLCRSNVCFP